MKVRLAAGGATATTRWRWPGDERRGLRPALLRAARAIRSGLAELDVATVAAVAVLSLLSFANLFAIGEPALATHQVVSIGLGVLLMAIVQHARGHLLGLIVRATYAFAIVLLVVVTFSGHSVHGAKRWISLGFVILQPSELAKLGLLLILSEVLGGGREDSRRRTLWALGLGAVPIGLTAHQPDLSTAGLLLAVTVTALLLGRVRVRTLVVMAAGAAAVTAAVLPLAHRLLRPYQAERLDSFLSGSYATDPSGAGFQAMQAHVAVAAGGLLGISRDPRHQLWAQYLPARQTDLAFASLVEQWGLLAGALAIASVTVIIWRLAVVARASRSSSAGIMAGVLGLLFGVEVAVNVAGNLSALPLAGVPFPVLSYGGTAATAHVAALGLVLSARQDAERRRLWLAPFHLRRQPRLMRLGAAGLTGVQLALGLAAWQLQDTQGPVLTSYGLAEMTRCFRLPAPRGQITDRHGAVVAENEPASRLLAVPRVLLGTPGAEGRLSSLGGLPEPALHQLLSAHSNSLSLELGRIPPRLAADLSASDIPGAVVTPSDQRRYPYGAALGPMLGFTSIASPDDMRERPGLPLGARVGRGGLESRYDEALRGRDGRQCVFVDPLGQPVAMAWSVAPVAGRDLRLGLDLDLQLMADARLQQSMATSTSDQVGAVVMDARSGQILAMASRPAYDNNLFSGRVDLAAVQVVAESPGQPFLEHVVQTASPPGSTFKLVTAAANAIHGAIPPGEVIPTGYWFHYGTGSWHNWRDLPPQNLPDAIAWSNDVYFYKLALALGADRMIDTAQQLGVGQPTGIDLPGENAGYLGTPETIGEIGQVWYPGATIILGIGQGYLTATPLQDARWTAAVATGSLVTPHLGLAVRDPDRGTLSPIEHPAPRPLPFAGALGPVREGMRRVVTAGTGDLLRGIPFEVGGKTGTAEDVSTVSGDADGWFTAAAPMSDPEVVMTMEARGSGEGYFVAEPAIADIMRYYVAHREQIREPVLAEAAGPGAGSGRGARIRLLGS